MGGKPDCSQNSYQTRCHVPQAGPSWVCERSDFPGSRERRRASDRRSATPHSTACPTAVLELCKERRKRESSPVRRAGLVCCQDFASKRRAFSLKTALFWNWGCESLGTLS